jgi:hypothetical protein
MLKAYLFVAEFDIKALPLGATAAAAIIPRPVKIVCLNRGILVRILAKIIRLFTFLILFFFSLTNILVKVAWKYPLYLKKTYNSSEKCDKLPRISCSDRSLTRRCGDWPVLGESAG